MENEQLSLWSFGPNSWKWKSVAEIFENLLFAAIWNDFRSKFWKCLKINAFRGLWAENAPTWSPQDRKLAFWIFEVSALIRDNSSLELKMLENQLFAAIWSDLRCKCRICSKMGVFLGLWAENAPKWLPRDKKWACWVFEVSALIIDNSSLELKMLENQLFAAIWSDLRCKCRKCLKMGAFLGLWAENASKVFSASKKMSFLSLWIFGPNYW